MGTMAGNGTLGVEFLSPKNRDPNRDLLPQFHSVLLKDFPRDFPGGPVAQTPHSQSQGPGFSL